MSLGAIHSRDWMRPYGTQRPDLPPDDELTDLAAWLAAQFDNLAADIEQQGEEG